MTLNVNLLLCYQCYAYCDRTTQARITRFRCKVALYFSYLHIKFDDEIKETSFEFQA